MIPRQAVERLRIIHSLAVFERRLRIVAAGIITGVDSVSRLIRNVRVTVTNAGRIPRCGRGTQTPAPWPYWLIAVADCSFI